jgi:hypothetical protein
LVKLLIIGAGNNFSGLKNPSLSLRKGEIDDFKKVGV